MSQFDAVYKWREVYADNRDPYDYDRGVLAFSRKFFPNTIKVRYGVSKTHVDIYRDCLSMYDPTKIMKEERQIGFVVYRGGGKSTSACHIFPTYIACMNGFPILLENGHEATIQEELIVIASETNFFATNWVNAIRSEMGGNKELRRFFGNVKQTKVRDDEAGVWRHDCFIAQRDKLEAPFTGKKLGIIGRGAGQQIRGLNIPGLGRPTMLIADDIYSANGIITPETRAKTRYWFFQEAMNTVDGNNGKAVVIGTVVHEDTVIVDIMNNKQDWKVIEKPIMDVKSFTYLLDKYCVVNRDLKTCEIPDRETCRYLEEQGYQTDWPEYFPLESMFRKFRTAITNQAPGAETGFWQEFFHLTIAESDKVFKKENFKVVDFEHVTKYINNSPVLFVSTVDSEGNKVWRNINSIVAIDTASSKQLGSAMVAIVWVGMDYYKKLYVLVSKSGRYGVSDTYEQGIITKIGFVNETLRVINGNSPHNIKIAVEVYNVGEEAIRQFRVQMDTATTRYIVFPVTQKDDKEERILQTLSSYYQTGSVVHRPGQQTLQTQLEYLGKSTLKDEADAMEMAVRNLRAPTKLIPFDEQAKEQKFISPLQNILKNKTNIKAKEQWKVM